MKVYAVPRGDDGDSVFLFTTREAALQFAGDDSAIEEQIVYDGQPPTWTYWHRGASVFPDGTIEDWTSEHSAQGEITIRPVDDHLNTRDEPWDGHTQSHCGEHVSILGTDRDAVEAAYQRAVAAALARQSGICQSKYKIHDGDVDGRTVFEAGFMRAREAQTGAPVIMECYPWRTHLLGEWSPWRDVGLDTQNRLAICERCASCCVQVRHSVHSIDEP